MSLSSILESDFVFNLIPILVLGGLIMALVSAGRQPLWAEAYRRMRRNKLAWVAFIVIALYGAVALLDSFGLTDKESQTRVTVLDKIALRDAEKT